jgi:hypothetical protein
MILQALRSSFSSVGTAFAYGSECRRAGAHVSLLPELNWHLKRQSLRPKSLDELYFETGILLTHRKWM